MKYILFVDSNKVAEEIIKQVGESSIIDAYNFAEWIENYPSDVLPDVISIPNIEKYSQSGGGR